MLISKFAIEIHDEYGRFIEDNPIDFLRMVARKTVWGNEGSLYAISKALNLNLYIIAVDNRNMGIISSVFKYYTETAEVSRQLTLINEINCHFVAAHSKLSQPMVFEQRFLKENITVHSCNLNSLFARMMSSKFNT